MPFVSHVATRPHPRGNSGVTVDGTMNIETNVYQVRIRWPGFLMLNVITLQPKEELKFYRTTAGDEYKHYIVTTPEAAERCCCQQYYHAESCPMYPDRLTIASEGLSGGRGNISLDEEKGDFAVTMNQNFTFAKVNLGTHDVYFRRG